ncbi:MAG TPA: hypothetical protein VFI25_01200 [Planctomycetota bacterium]|jgi:pimeloyl-ACP methyl ester carboxylesterase|nr:hypothetical protein [Planctomycetota bacterium]
MRARLVPALFLLLGAQGKGKPEPVEPGKVVGRRADNGMTYALRIPKSYDAKRGARALLVLHGSNMSGRAYLETIAAAGWFPDDLLIGPDGRNPGGAEGAHNFDEGSAKGVVEVFDEVAKEWKVAKAFVGGHSQAEVH